MGRPWLLGLWLLCGGATTALQRELVGSMEQEGFADGGTHVSHGPTYQYRVIDFGWCDPHTVEDFLNRAGRLGWRVAVQSGTMVTFERRVE